MKLVSVLSFLVVLVCLPGCSSGDAPSDAAEGPDPGKVFASKMLFLDPECAEQGLPVGLEITNGADRPTSRVRWWFSVNKRNHSDNLAYEDESTTLFDAHRSSDRIIQPGETYKVCSSAPNLSEAALPSELEYHVTVSPTF